MQLSRHSRARVLRLIRALETLGLAFVHVMTDRRAARDFMSYVYMWRPLPTRVPSASLPEVVPAARDVTVELRNCFGGLGNPSVQEIYTICALIQTFSPAAIFEFGTFTGLTTFQMAINVPPETVIYTLNLPPDSAATVNELSDRDTSVVPRVAGTGQIFADQPEKSRIVELFGDSARFDFSPYEQSVDLVFIDAGHDYANVRSDTENAVRLLRDGRGTLVWHDFLNAPGVTGYLEEFAATHRVHRITGTKMAVALLQPSSGRSDAQG